MRKRLKEIFDKHWNCIPWFICGMAILIKGDIGRGAYGLTWITVLILLWRYCPTISINRLEEGKE